jgi:hypothetical protein
MTTTIDAPGLAKVSTGDLLRELTNERARVKRRRVKAQEKLAGIKVLKEDLRLYLQPDDWEHIHDRLEREADQWERRENDLARRVSEETHRQKMAGTYWHRPAW